MYRLSYYVRIVCGCAAAISITAVMAAPAGGAVSHRLAHRTVHHRHHRRRAHPPAAPARCAGADSQAAAPLQTLRSAVVCLVNQQRTKRGLPALGASDQLNSSAQAWTRTMVLTGQFTHGPGDAFAHRISATGYDWQTAGENIATGFPTPRAVVSAWMASTDHCRNILDPSFRDVGTGESNSAVGTFASEPATWTQDFGLRMSSSARSHNQGPMNGCPY